jgi:hypothetical protein
MTTDEWKVKADARRAAELDDDYFKRLSKLDCKPFMVNGMPCLLVLESEAMSTRTIAELSPNFNISSEKIKNTCTECDVFASHMSKMVQLGCRPAFAIDASVDPAGIYTDMTAAMATFQVGKKVVAVHMITSEPPDTTTLGTRVFPHFHYKVMEDASAEAKSAAMTKAKNVKHVVDRLVNNGIGEPRMEKFCDPKFVESMEFLKGAMNHPGLFRKEEFWGSSMQWIGEVHTLLRGRDFTRLIGSDRLIFMTECVTRGKVSGDVNLDFQRADNFLNICSSCTTLDAAVALMNSLSNPLTHRVSQLSEKIKIHNVSDYAFILEWDTADDLDLHVKVSSNGRLLEHVYFGNKKGRYCELKFDANVAGDDKEPSECIDLTETAIKMLPSLSFRVYVQNFTHRSYDSEVPFKLSVRENGEMIPLGGIEIRKWHKHAEKDVFCGEHGFSAGSKKTLHGDDGLKLTEIEIRRTNAQMALMQQKLGSGTSTVARVEECGALALNKMEESGGGSGKIKTLGDLLSATKVSSESKYGKLARGCARTLPSEVSLAELIAFLEKHVAEGVTMSLCPRDFCPAYAVLVSNEAVVEEKSEEFRKVSVISFQMFENAGASMTPSAETLRNVGVNRYDASWFSDAGFVTSARRVTHFIPTVPMTEGRPFFVLENARVPPPESMWQLMGGFAASQLPSEFHAFRSLWVSQNSMVRPRMPSGGNLVIGVIPPSKFSVIVNGKVVDVK